MVSEGGNVTAPAHGTNRTWDYSGLMADDNFQMSYQAATRSGFTSYNRFYLGNAYLGMIPMTSEYYTQITADGLFEVGSYKLPQAIGIGSFSGSSSDTLRFPGSNNIFSNPAALLKFPCTYGNTWNADHEFNTPFSLSVGAFALNNTPGSQRQRVYQTDSVVGWGKLILPTASGPSNPMDVLLVKVSKFYVDSYFLAGNPAPAALLAAFGLAQSDTGYLHSYEFYAAGGEMSLLSIWVDADWDPYGFQYRSNGIFPLADNKHEVQNTAVYPNPATAGQRLFVDVSNASNNLQMNLFDLQGRSVYTWSGSATAAGNGILLPATLSGGNYIFRLSSNGAVLQNGKLTID
jgi:hypothetical protein